MLEDGRYWADMVVSAEDAGDHELAAERQATMHDLFGVHRSAEFIASARCKRSQPAQRSTELGLAPAGWSNSSTTS